MIIEILAINEVQPNYRKGQPTSLRLAVDLDKELIQKLFHSVWQNIGDKGVQEILEAEGYKLTKQQS